MTEKHVITIVMGCALVTDIYTSLCDDLGAHL